jgi:hypothetical protein
MLLNSDPGTQYAAETILATMEALERHPHGAKRAQQTALDPVSQQA